MVSRNSPSQRAEAVLFAVSALSLGGKEKILSEVANGLVGRGVQGTIVNFSAINELKVELENVDVVSLPRESRYDLSFIPRLRRMLASVSSCPRLTFDLFSYLAFRLATMFSLPQSPMYVSIHSSSIQSTKEDIFWRIFSFVMRREDHIISICEFQKDFYSKRYGIDPRKFSTIYNGVDVAYFNPESVDRGRDEICRSFGLPSGRKYIVQVANLRAQKDYGTSFRAMKLFVDEHFDDLTDLLVVGSGPDEAELKSMVQALQLESRVVFLGKVRNVRDLYCISNVFTLSSSFNETFSIAALEAMSMGLPSVITDVGGAREMIADGVNGIVVPPRAPSELAEGWRQALSPRWQDVRVRIRETAVEKFSLEACVDGYYRLLFSHHMSNSI